jgi:diguanylate cyclase (GGDEF)-like protein/PAS domain S-box-containing protein
MRCLVARRERGENRRDRIEHEDTVAKESAAESNSEPQLESANSEPPSAPANSEPRLDPADRGLPLAPDGSSGDNVSLGSVERLLRVSDAALTHLAVDELLEELLDRVRDALGGDMAAVLALDPDNDMLVPRAAVGLEPGDAEPLGIPFGRGISGSVAASRDPLVVDDAALASGASPFVAAAGVASMVVAPLVSDGSVTGVIHVGSREVGRFTPRDAALLALVAGRVALAIDRARLVDDLVDREAQMRAVLDTARDAIVTIDDRRTILSANPATQRLFGFPAEGLAGTSFDALIAEPDRVRLAELTSDEAGGENRRSDLGQELAGLREDGSTFPVELVMSQTVVRGERRYIAMMRDITERREAERLLRHAALHDPLTGLANRTLLMARCEQAIAALARRGGNVAALFLDLDRFKLVNDSLGHRVADELLVTLGHRLQESVRPEDTVSRLGGDEFVVLCEDLASPDGAVDIARRLLAALRRPLPVLGAELFASASIGIALADDPSMPADDLLRNADAAMYRAKDRGRNRFEMFDSDLQDEAFARLRLEGELHRALERDELRLHFQPEIDLRTGAVVGAEALLRWHHPERGLLAPEDFLPAAEESGLIVPMGAWVLREACRRARGWEGGPGAPLTVWVNLSPVQLSSHDLLDTVEQGLREADLRPEQLRLEVTEGALMEEPLAAARALRSLRDMGVGVAIDDFGTGYSSLAYLRTFPADSVKLDRLFVAALGHDTQAASIVGAVAALARSLDMTPVAEGVETAAQLAILVDHGYQLAQGFYFGGPDDALDLRSRAPLLHTGA